MRLLCITLVVAAACTHTDVYPTGPFEHVGPIPGTERLTFNPNGDAEPGWSADGQQVVYIYYPDDQSIVHSLSQCIGIVPIMGGTRTMSFCDNRSILSDSISLYTAAALRPNGELLFEQTIATPMKNISSARSMILWIADTSSPVLVRRKLATFPQVIGDSVVDHLTDVRWVDANTFVAVGQDTLSRALYLVRGVLSGDQVLFHQIAGTDTVAHWSTTGGGQILFVVGAYNEVTIGSPTSEVLVEDSVIQRVPIAGGTVDTFAKLSRESIRDLACGGAKCLVLSSTRASVLAGYVIRSSTTRTLQLDSRIFSMVTLSDSDDLAWWDSVKMDPTGETLVYRRSSDVLRSDGVTVRLGNLYRAVLPLP